MPARQRRKLWELASHLYCSIVGTCLSTTELRKVVAKFKGHELKGFSDLAIHEEAVKAAAHHDVASRLLHKALDRRHEATIKRFHGARLLYVGGRHGHIHRIRAFVEEAQAEFLHHDGGVEERKGLLAGIVSRADAIFFPVDCVSHDTVAVLKRLCRQTGKPYLPLRSTSLTSFIAALRRLEWPELEESSRT